MSSGTDGHTTRALLCPVLLGLWLVLAIPAVSGKVACGYSNRLCQWQSSYAFAAAVVEDKVFYHGGTQANSPGPVNSVKLEVLDLQSLTPLVVDAQLSPNILEAVISTRSGHHMIAWDGRLLLLGGVHESAPGVPLGENRISVFDLTSRTWSWLKDGNITLPTKTEFYSDVLYERVALSGDTLLAVMQSTTEIQSLRSLQALDLKAGRSFVESLPGDNDSAAAMRDWRLVGLMAGLDGNQSALAVQATRTIPSCSPDSILWSATNDFWRQPAISVSCKGFTTLKPAQDPSRTTAAASSSPQVLVLKLLRLQSRPILVMLANTVATFGTSPAQRMERNVTIMLVHDMTTSGGSSSKTRSLSLQLRHLLLTPPLGQQLSQLQSVVLPLHGRVLVGPGDVVIELPYVGDVGLVSFADSSNANIQEVADGFVVRGLGRADPSCQPGADWAPFLIHVGFKGQGQPVVSARSNYSWCVTRPAQAAAEQVVTAVQGLSTNGQLLSIESADGPLLAMLGPQMRLNAASVVPARVEAPYMGAYINLRDSRAYNFTVALDKDYNLTRPSRTCSCVASLDRQSVYVEAGGAYFVEETETFGVMKGVFTMVMHGQGGQKHQLVRVAGGDVIPQRAQAAVACGPEGQVWMFGGVGLVNATEGTWAPSDDLVALRISRSGAAADSSSYTGTRAAVEAAVRRITWPGPRSGHALVYLPPELSKRFESAKGALLMYGGSDINAVSLTTAAMMDATFNDNVTWDTQLWLYDVAGKTWSTLEATGTPPRLMYHAMTLAGSQLVIFGGQQLQEDRNDPVTQSTDVHVVDLEVTPLRWRRAPVDQIKTFGLDPLSFPGTSAVSVPGQKVIALKHFRDLYVIPLPQTLKVTLNNTNLQRWGLTSLNVTAGDWVRLEATGKQPVPLQQPLILSGDVIFTGAVTGAVADRKIGAAAGPPTLQCAAAANSTAILIRSAGVEVENIVVRGCKNNAVDVTFPGTTVSTNGNNAVGVQLRNLTFVANSGDAGVALRLGQNASTRLSGCVFLENTASASVLQADRGTVLRIVDCNFTLNTGTAIVFNGSSMTVYRSSFVDNKASTSALRKRFATLQLTRTKLTTTSQVDELAAVENAQADLGMAADAAAIRVPQDADRQLRSCYVNVTNTSFVSNVGGAGGAVFLGAYALANFTNCNFTGNAAYWLGGGAIFASRDACLQASASTFLRNTAQPNTWGAANSIRLIKSMHHGGAIWMQSPSCGLNWQGTHFEGNVADSEGGAVAISDSTAREVNLTDCTFSANKALNGSGGAVSLYAISSKVHLAFCTLLNNTASEGGALYIRSTSTKVQLSRCTASGNSAVGTTPASASSEEYASHHGGALSMSGTVSKLTLAECRFHANQARGQGGAVYVIGSGGERGDTTSGMSVKVGPNITYSSNTAHRSGGAVYVSRAQLEVDRTQMSHNAVKVTQNAPVASAGGGGLCCDECVVQIHDSAFLNNAAALGGGVAVLRAESANIRSSVFEANTANASAGMSPTATSASPFSSRSSDQEAQYLGGGGLYLTTDKSSLSNLTFTQNTAPVAGGIYLQLRRGNVNHTATLADVKVAPVITSSSSGGTAGLLYNGPISQMLIPRMCEPPSSSPAHAKCVATALATWQTNAFTRRLLQEDAASLMPSDPSSNPVTAAARNVFATTAVQLRLVQLSQQKWAQRLPRPLFVNVSGEPLQDLSVQLIDALGILVDSNIRDASMPIVASVHSNGQPLKVAMINNVTNANKGVATFSDLRIWAPSGYAPSLELVFDTAAAELQKPLKIRLEVNRTRCQVGEYSRIRDGELTDETSAGSLPLKWECTECTAPLYSFIPEANQCSVCPAKAVCNLYYAIPLSGSYQSHPRNPLILDCLLPGACRRSEQQQQELQNIVGMLRNEPTNNITQMSVRKYAAAMCSTGYEGPLCGACSKGYGRAGSGCTRCFNSAVLCCAVLCCLWRWV